jgi:hypothetical protein
MPFPLDLFPVLYLYVHTWAQCMRPSDEIQFTLVSIFNCRYGGGEGPSRYARTDPVSGS